MPCASRSPSLQSLPTPYSAMPCDVGAKKQRSPCLLMRACTNNTACSYSTTPPRAHLQCTPTPACLRLRCSRQSKLLPALTDEVLEINSAQQADLALMYKDAEYGTCAASQHRQIEGRLTALRTAQRPSWPSAGAIWAAWQSRPATCQRPAPRTHSCQTTREGPPTCRP